MSGILYVVATPIGNLSDITLRAIETLRECDIIACEDTRHTDQLLHHLGFRKKLVRYDEHSHHRALKEILFYLESGKNISLVTDAGTPTISDPGSRLIAELVKKQIKVIPIPGASSVIAALSGSGIVGEGFVFLGFLPRKKGPASRLLQGAMGLGKTISILESPFRVVATLELLKELAPNAWVVVARELTKIHEEFVRGSVSNVLDHFQKNEPRGEVVILVGEEFKPSLEGVLS